MISDTDVLMTSLGKRGVVTVDMGGNVRLWETNLETLQRSLQEWRNMIGQEDGRPIQVRCYNMFCSSDSWSDQPRFKFND